MKDEKSTKATHADVEAFIEALRVAIDEERPAHGKPGLDPAAHDPGPPNRARARGIPLGLAESTRSGRFAKGPAWRTIRATPPATTLETSPFPEGLSLDVPVRLSHRSTVQAIASAARRLVELHDRWLSPPEWVEWIEEPAPGTARREDGEGAQEADPHQPLQARPQCPRPA